MRCLNLLMKSPVRSARHAGFVVKTQVLLKMLAGTEKEVMVAWPHEFAKVSKKIVKGSIDPASVLTTTCVAKVIKFSGKCLLVFLVSISELDLFKWENIWKKHSARGHDAITIDCVNKSKILSSLCIA